MGDLRQGWRNPSADEIELRAIAMAGPVLWEGLGRVTKDYWRKEARAAIQADPPKRWDELTVQEQRDESDHYWDQG